MLLGQRVQLAGAVRGRDDRNLRLVEQGDLETIPERLVLVGQQDSHCVALDEFVHPGAPAQEEDRRDRHEDDDGAVDRESRQSHDLTRRSRLRFHRIAGRQSR